jgi:hypothetical protein
MKCHCGAWGGGAVQMTDRDRNCQNVPSAFQRRYISFCVRTKGALLLAKFHPSIDTKDLKESFAVKFATHSETDQSEKARGMYIKRLGKGKKVYCKTQKK